MFHRDVVTDVEVDMKQRSLLDASLSCHLQLVEHIPSGAYVDVYQIRATSDLEVKPHSGTHPIRSLYGCVSD